MFSALGKPSFARTLHRYQLRNRAMGGGGADNGLNFRPNCSGFRNSLARATPPQGAAVKGIGSKGTPENPRVYLWLPGGGRCGRPLALPPSGPKAKSHARAVPGAPKLVREVPGERARGGRAPAAAETRRPSLRATRESGGRSRNFRAGGRAGGRTCHARGPPRPAARTLPQPPRPSRPSRRPARSPPQAALGRVAPAASCGAPRTHRAWPRRGRSPLPAAPAQPRALGAGRRASAVTGPRPGGGRAEAARRGAERQAWRPQRRAGLLSWGSRRGAADADAGAEARSAGDGPRRTRTTCWRSRATGAAQGPNGSRRLRLRGPRGRGAGKVGGLPGQRLRPPPAPRGGITGLSQARGRRRTSRRGRRAVPPARCKQPGGRRFPREKGAAGLCRPGHLSVWV